VVDHLLVFKGDGVIKDFPGNYTQYRQWEALKSKEEEAAKTNTTEQKEKKQYRNDTRRRLSYKEKREMEQLEADIERLEEEQKNIETALSSGAITVEEITTMSKRLPVLKEELDEKSNAMVGTFFFLSHSCFFFSYSSLFFSRKLSAISVVVEFTVHNLKFYRCRRSSHEFCGCQS